MGLSFSLLLQFSLFGLELAEILSATEDGIPDPEV
jgi:hypothetical protein